MALSFVRASKFALSLLMGAVLVVGCSAGPRPQVLDVDSYQVINIGQLRYTTPNGYRVTETSGGTAYHEAQQLPGTMIVVAYDTNPPRNLSFDADAEKRKFLEEVPNGELGSAQYSENDGRKTIKVFANGLTRSKEQLRGSLIMVREGNRTATIRLIGPWADRNEINRQAEALAASLDFGDSTPTPRMTAKN